MDTDKALGQVALSVPVFHVVACSIFLSGYSIGFGDQVGTLFSISDFFTVSLEHLVRMYVLGLGIPFAMIMYRHRSGNAYAADKIAAETDQEKRAQLIESRDFVVSLLTWGFWILGALVLLALILAVHYDLPRQYFVTVSVLALCLSPIWWRLMEKAKFFGLGAELAWLAVIFAINLVSLGMDAGFRDRRSSFKMNANASYACGSNVILIPAGDRFITVSPDNRRRVIDESCRILFSFPTISPVRYQSILGAVREDLTGRPQSTQAPRSDSPAPAVAPATPRIRAY